MGPFDGLASHAHWLLRIALASVFGYHGSIKFPIAENMAGFLGVPTVAVLAIALMEVGVAVCIILGGLLPGRIGDTVTRLGGLLVLPPMVGAISRFHWGRWDFGASQTHPLGGMEFQVTLVLIGLFFALRGNGAGRAVTAST